MIRVITVEREFGAGGTIIAEKLAERLGWKLWDQALTAEIARLAQVDPASVERLDERCDSLFYRLMKVFIRGSYERSLPVTGLAHFDADSMVAFMHRVIDGAAAEGNCVIVGRGAPYFLRDREDAFHVFVYAPWEEKIRRVRMSGKSEEDAVDLARHNRPGTRDIRPKILRQGMAEPAPLSPNDQFQDRRRLVVAGDSERRPELR